MCTVKCTSYPLFLLPLDMEMSRNSLYNFRVAAEIRIAESSKVRTAPCRKSKESYAECELSMLLER